MKAILLLRHAKSAWDDSRLADHDRPLSRRGERAAKAIARPELTIKDLRHIAAIAWVKAGVHIRLVQRWLGHTTLTETMKYTDYEPDAGMAVEMAERAAATLNQTAGVIALPRPA